MTPVKSLLRPDVALMLAVAAAVGLLVLFLPELSFAQAADAGAQAAGDPGMMGAGTTQEFVLGTVKFFGLGLLVYYMLVMLPRNAEESNHKKFIDGLSKNDEVVTAGGLLGKVVSVASDSITIELGPNVKVRVLPKFVKARNAADKNGGTSGRKAESSPKSASA